MADMSKKGRGVGLRGSDNGNSCLTWARVREIRQLYRDKRGTQRELASLYGVSQGAIWQIVNNKQWVE